MRLRTVLTCAAALCGLAIAAIAGAGPPAIDAIWADGYLFRTVDTGNSLPDKGPKDGIFVFPALPGQRAVAEAKPGDRDYNGGRWQVYVINVLDEGAVDHEFTSWEEVQQYISEDVLEIGGMGPTFVCPMIP
jgi:hypothetical protein